MEIGIDLSIVSKDKDDKTVFLKETIDTEDVISFRNWKKGNKDKDVDGDMTLVLVKPKSWDRDPNQPRRLLIHEPYDSFVLRMRTNGVVVK